MPKHPFFRPCRVPGRWQRTPEGGGSPSLLPPKFGTVCCYPAEPGGMYCSPSECRYGDGKRVEGSGDTTSVATPRLPRSAPIYASARQAVCQGQPTSAPRVDISCTWWGQARQSIGDKRLTVPKARESAPGVAYFLSRPPERVGAPGGIPY